MKPVVFKIDLAESYATRTLKSVSTDDDPMTWDERGDAFVWQLLVDAFNAESESKK